MKPCTLRPYGICKLDGLLFNNHIYLKEHPNTVYIIESTVDGGEVIERVLLEEREYDDFYNKSEGWKKYTIMKNTYNDSHMCRPVIVM